MGQAEPHSFLSDDRVRVVYEGSITEPQLDHPEGLAVHRDGSVWCGGERGQIYRLSPDEGRLEQVGSTEGFCLGMAFDAEDNLFVCDLKLAAVMRFDVRTGRVERFADGAAGRPLRIPNYPAFDEEGRLYVSDSHAFRQPGPGVFRFEPGGAGEVWYGQAVDFANGLALGPDGRHLYVAETFGHSVFRIPIGDDGSAGDREEVARLDGVLPDGLAFDVEGRLYVGCYEPSQVLRVATGGAASCCTATGRPTRCAIRPTSPSGAPRCSPRTWAGGRSQRSRLAWRDWRCPVRRSPGDAGRPPWDHLGP
jgi:gluconolactonase